MKPRQITAAALLFTAITLLAQTNINPPATTATHITLKGIGYQIYTCTSTPSGIKWIFKSPQASLRDNYGKEVGSHFAGPTWQLHNAAGAIIASVKGEVIATQPSPEANSVAWLLLRPKPGTATGTFTKLAYIQRTKTNGGAATNITAPCRTTNDLGKTQNVPYTATYTFYFTQ